MVNVFLAIVFTVFATATIAEDVAVEEGVLVLTADNFEQVINDNEFVLVEFYAPWCGHCKKLAPEYAKAAQKLAEEGSAVKLGKVDATVHSTLGGQFGVRGYPTLKFFKDGEATDYTGGRTESTIVSWLKKKSGPPAVTLSSVEEAEKLLKNEVAIIGFFKDMSADAMNFLKVAGNIEDFQFGITSDEALFNEYKVEKNSVALFKKFDELRNDLTESFTAKSITTFINSNSLPLFNEFTQQNGQKLFGMKDMPFLCLVMSKTSDSYDTTAETFTSLAKSNKGKLRVIFVDSDVQSNSRVLGMFGVTVDDTPTYRIYNPTNSLKYMPESSDLAEDSVSGVIAKYLAGELKPFLKSAAVPEDWNAKGVKVLVGKNFKEVALDPTMNVLVEFYAPWCGHCKKLTPVWDDLGEKYVNSKNVIIAKFDATENEVEEVSIRGFPTIKFFPAEEYTKPVDYNGGRSLEDFVAFLEKAAPQPKEEAEPEAQPDSKQEKEAKKDEL